MISEETNTAATATPGGSAGIHIGTGSTGTAGTGTDTADGTGATAGATTSWSCIVSDILACYCSLSEVDTLDPCPYVDALFGRLVHLCLQTPADATTARVGVSST